VTGSLSGYPTTATLKVYLSKLIRSNTYFSDNYSARLDSSGHFAFASVLPGKYNLSAAVGAGGGVYWIDPTTRDPYSIVVPPLCNLNLAQPYPYSA
jgi:hypothetical protein